ncbi:MAG TPA: tyrosine--tRNA ligase [Ktedonobacteraceae bacterium]|nr:tyrosine--tRNA ligase [Ktedonobacteraceae bacterium]
MNAYEEFQWRGMLYDASEGLREALAKESLTGYIGFDPTAASLHVGSLLPIMGLMRLQQYGHTPIALVGGGTGMIGDPSGKTVERQLLSKEQLEFNLAGIREQLSRFLDFERKTNAAMLVNNADWLGPLGLIDFLRDIGKHFTVNYMLAKESVRRRYEQGDGISFTEFSYMLLQSYDFLVLHDRYGCTLQLGGSDQWGNIVAGAELIRKLRGEQGGRGFGLVFPLVMTSSGIKFGKSEAGTVWLDANLTSPYRFYQYWINTDDRDVVKYLKFFTMFNQDEIAALEASVEIAPEKREAQRQLAQDVTRRVHGEHELRKAMQASQVLFGGEIADLSARDVLDIFAEVPSSDLPRASFEGDGLPIIDAVLAAGYATSRGAARRLIEGGGIYVNNRRVSNPQATLRLSELIDGQIMVLRKGAKDYHLIRAV